MCLVSTYMYMVTYSLSMPCVSCFPCRYYKPLFKVVEKEENAEDKMFGNRLGIIIDKSLKDFENMRDPEVNDFRLYMIDKCRNAVEVNESVVYTCIV